MNPELVREERLREMARVWYSQLMNRTDRERLAYKAGARAALAELGIVSLVEVDPGELRLGCEPGVCLGDIGPGDTVLIRAKAGEK